MKDNRDLVITGRLFQLWCGQWLAYWNLFGPVKRRVKVIKHKVKVTNKFAMHGAKSQTMSITTEADYKAFADPENFSRGGPTFFFSK